MNSEQKGFVIKCENDSVIVKHDGKIAYYCVELIQEIRENSALVIDSFTFVFDKYSVDNCLSFRECANDIKAFRIPFISTENYLKHL